MHKVKGKSCNAVHWQLTYAKPALGYRSIGESPARLDEDHAAAQCKHH